MSRNTATLFTLTFLLATLLGLVGPLPMALAQASDVEQVIIPQGRWLLHARIRSETERTAINTLRETVPLLEYLVPDSTIRSQLSGDVERHRQRLDLSFRYGFSDNWNVAVELPFIKIEQTSTVSGAGSSAVTQQVSRLADRSEAGLGSLKLVSLHRGFFRDTQAFSWGYGLLLPLGSPDNKYAGRSTFYLDSPFRYFLFTTQYEQFLTSFRGKFEFDGEFHAAFERELTGLNGYPVNVSPGNRIMLSFRWEQEFGPVYSSLGLRRFQQQKSSEDGQKGADKMHHRVLSLKLGWGDLRKLEKGPRKNPFLLYMLYEKTLAGFNVPLTSVMGVSLKIYF